MSEEKRTTKYVEVTLKVTYHGSYVGVDEVVANLQGHIDSGFNDRDDLRGWDFGPAIAWEVDGDPEGYDA